MQEVVFLQVLMSFRVYKCVSMCEYNYVGSSIFPSVNVI